MTVVLLTNELCLCGDPDCHKCFPKYSGEDDYCFDEDQLRQQEVDDEMIERHRRKGVDNH